MIPTVRFRRSGRVFQHRRVFDNDQPEPVIVPLQRLDASVSGRSGDGEPRTVCSLRDHERQRGGVHWQSRGASDTRPWYRAVYADGKPVSFVMVGDGVAVD